MAFRIIARIDVKPPWAVKGVQLEGLRRIGTPGELAEKYYSLGIDEIIFQDVVASLYGAQTLGGIDNFEFPNVFIPVTVGGGISTVENAIAVVQQGSDKISLNSAALRNPKLIREVSNILGAQAVVVSIEAKSNQENSWDLMMDSGRETSEKPLDRWLLEIQELGAGEVVLTSVDREGTCNGIDHRLIEFVRKRIHLPLIVHGGIGGTHDILDAINLGADGVAIASALHYGMLEIAEIKRDVRKSGYEVRI